MLWRGQQALKKHWIGNAIPFLHWNLDEADIFPSTEFIHSQLPCELASGASEVLTVCWTAWHEVTGKIILQNPQTPHIPPSFGDLFNDSFRRSQEPTAASLRNKIKLQRTVYILLWLKFSTWKMDIISAFHWIWRIFTKFRRQHFFFLYKAVWHLKNQARWSKVLNEPMVCDCFMKH